MGQAGILCMEVKISKQRCKYFRAVMQSSTEGVSISKFSPEDDMLSSVLVTKKQNVEVRRKGKDCVFLLLTGSSDILQKAQNAVYGCIRKYQWIVSVDKNFKHIKQNVDLTRFTVFPISVHKRLSANHSESTKQRPPA